MYEVRQAGTKGLGVFAKSLIPRGTRIFSERPLLFIRSDQDAGDIYALSRLLSIQDRGRILELSNINTAPILRWSQVLWYTAKQLPISVVNKLRDRTISFARPNLGEHHKILNIFRTNAFALNASSFHQAIFPEIARINHSCIPNSQGNFHEGSGRFNIHAIRDIAAEEELTINYLPEHGFNQETRQAGLAGYGFTCACPACDLSMLRGKAGEKRRADMQTVLRRFAETGGSGGTEAELKTLEKYIELFREEKIAGRELSSMYFEAATLNEKLGRMGNALKCAEEGLRIDLDCLGSDHAWYKDGLTMVHALRTKTQ